MGHGVPSEPQIAFHILGPIEINVEGRSIPLPGGHARSILGLLLLHPNRILSSDDLIDALWRDDPPRTAPNVLQAHVVTLRRALRAGGEAGGEALVARLETHSSGYLLPAQRMGNAVETAVELQGVAMAAAGTGDPELGIRLNAAAEATFAAIGFVFDVPSWTALLDRYLGPARDALGERTDAIDRDGRSLALEDAVREGLERSASPAGAV